MSLHNEAAFHALFDFLRTLPLPETIDDIHLRIHILTSITRGWDRQELIDFLAEEVYRTKSNNTTRQWISEILRLFSHAPRERVKEHLEKMLGDKRFSRRIRAKIEEILYEYP